MSTLHSDLMPAHSNEIIRSALDYARQALGPASELALSDPALQAKLLSRVRRGAKVSDAVLTLAHLQAKEDRRVADEFLAHFLCKLTRIGHISIQPQLKRFLGTGDLVNSVMGNLWKDFRNVRFEGEQQFLSYLSRKLHWKAADLARRMKAGKRREDQRASHAPEDLNLAIQQSGPASILAFKEKHELLVLALLRLPGHDQELLRAHMNGDSYEEIAARMEIKPRSARRAVQRAIEQLKRILADEID